MTILCMNFTAIALCYGLFLSSWVVMAFRNGCVILAQTLYGRDYSSACENLVWHSEIQKELGQLCVMQ